MHDNSTYLTLLLKEKNGLSALALSRKLGQPRATIGNPKTSDLAESVRKKHHKTNFTPTKKSSECITLAIKFAKSR